MDGVTSLRSWFDLSGNTFIYVPDPVYFPFDGGQYTLDESFYVEIQVLASMFCSDTKS